MNCRTFFFAALITTASWPVGAEETERVGLLDRIFHADHKSAADDDEEEGEGKEEKEVGEKESWLGGGVRVWWDSKYITAGIDEVPGSSVFSSELTLTAFDFTIGVAHHVGVSKQFQEWNFLADYTHTFGPVELSLGYVYIDLPINDLAFHDGYLGVSLPKIPWVRPSLELSVDLERLDGGFLEFALNSEIPIVPGMLKFEPYVAAALAYNYSSAVSESLDDTQLRIGARLPLALTESVTLTARAEHIFSENLRDETWFRVDLGWEF